MSGIDSSKKMKKLAKAAATAATLRVETAGAADITPPSSLSQMGRLLPPNRSEGNALTTTVGLSEARSLPVQHSPTEGVVDPEKRINKRARSDSEISSQGECVNAMFEGEARNLSTGSGSQRSSTPPRSTNVRSAQILGSHTEVKSIASNITINAKYMTLDNTIIKRACQLCIKCGVVENNFGTSSD
jgi:hypothetical protein